MKGATVMVTDGMEDELRGAFVKAAAEFQNPEQARQRLLQRDYHPRRVSRRGAAGITAAVAGGALVLSLAVAGVFGSAARGPAHSTSPIHLAAFTLVSNPDGTTTLTLRPQEFNDPAVLRHALAQHSIPALVKIGSFCSSNPEPPSNRAVRFSAPPLSVSAGHRHPAGQATVIIDPSALPAGTELSFGVFPRDTLMVSMTTIYDHAYTCTTSPPARRG
jgi:hypothetical protein